MTTDEAMRLVDALVSAALQAHELRTQVRKALEELLACSADTAVPDSNQILRAVMDANEAKMASEPHSPLGHLPPDVMASLLKQGRELAQAVESGVPMSISGAWSHGTPTDTVPPGDEACE